MKIVGAGLRPAPNISARRINAARQTPGVPVWQRDYYERILRSEQEYQQISQYIQANPANWDRDLHRR